MKSIQHKKIVFLVLPLFLIIGSFFIGHYAAAGIFESWAESVLTGLLSIFVWALGLILVLVIQGLVFIAEQQHFIDAQAVLLGWVIVRDICNMFFVVILMIIAFGTILHLENYNYKKWLPKLILMAILINFSKTICGLLIDVAQVVMLTFVNAFKDVGGANLTDMLGITTIVQMSNSAAGTAVGAYVLGIIYLLVAIVVIITMTAMLAIRMVMIWIYVVLSPAAYLLAAFPGGQKYASQWWTEFTKNLIVGPVLAFFLWLSLASLSGANPQKFDTSAATTNGNADLAKIQDSSSVGSVGGTPSALIKFIVGIGMLVGGLKISSEIGGAAGGIAGKGMSKIQKGASLTGAYALGRAKAVGGAVGRTARNTSLGLASATTKGVGSLINQASGPGGNKAGNALRDLGGVGLAWRSDMKAKDKKAKVDKRQKFLEKIGMGEKTMGATSDFLKTDAGKEISTAFHGASVGAALGAGGGIGGSIIGAGVGGVVGGAVSFGVSRFKNFLNRKSADKEADAAALRASGNIVGAEEAEKHSKWYKKAGGMAGSIQAFTSETTEKAATNGSKEIANAKLNVHNASLDQARADAFMKRDSSYASFYSTAGGQSKKFLEQLTSNNNPDSAAAISHIQNYINGLSGTSSDKELDTMTGLAKGIAAAKKGGMDVSRLSGLIAAINSKNSLGGVDGTHGMQGATVDSLNDSVIAYRQTGQIGEKGSGELAVNTLANNKQNIDGKNIVGVNFSKLKAQGVDINEEAEGANVSGAQKVQIASALIQEINTEQSNLASAKNNGEIDDQSFNSRNSELEKAKGRLSDPDEIENLSLVNTASKNYGRQEKMTSVYHEEIHKGGVEDEDLTEGMAKSLMANKLYGRNAETGGRHATEIAGLAKGMKDKGMTNEEVIKAIDTEIKSRVQGEGKNKAARVLKKESGQKETESNVIEEKHKEGSEKESSELNTEELQKNINELSKKFKDFELKSPGLLKSLGIKNDGLNSIVLTTLLKKIARSNEHIANKATTPLEVKVLAEESQTPPRLEPEAPVKAGGKSNESLKPEF
ncbi:MAG: hypothetical protein WC249_02800 [Patescibacteria group bacterium]|jgi:hypothetical protein